MQNNKSSGNDGLTKEFYETFWEDFFFNSIEEANEKQQLSSQRQTVIKLIKKKKNVYTKLDTNISIECRSHNNFKSSFRKTKVQYLHNKQLMLKKRLTDKSGKLISDTDKIEVANMNNIKGYLVTTDIKKAFDSLDYDFLLSVFSTSRHGRNFISWIKILLTNQDSFVINEAKPTKYFQREKGVKKVTQYWFFCLYWLLKFYLLS